LVDQNAFFFNQLHAWLTEHLGPAAAGRWIPVQPLPNQDFKTSISVEHTKAILTMGQVRENIGKTIENRDAWGH
jgi:hypothetical protein